jgi:aspartyl protease family protein
MTIGFIAGAQRVLTASVAALAILAPALCEAADISVNALFGGKAVLVIDGGKPRMLTAGQTTPEGVKLISATSEAAVVEYKGQRQTLGVGQGTRVATASPAGSHGGKTTLLADSRGHFYTTGQINGVTIKLMVDTGATTVALSAADARAIGINYRAGKRGMAHTANGAIAIWGIRLDSVRVGDITLNNVEASVSEGPPHTALLGMSFLNRTQMNRDGDRLTLIRRY